jgi:opacity protein-like surface antigen
LKRLIPVFLCSVLALSRVAQAQTTQPSKTAEPNKGYAEVVAQSAFGNVTSQSYGGEIGVTITPGLQVFIEGGQTRDVSTAAIGAAAQQIAGYISQGQSGVTYKTREPATFGLAGLRYIVPVDTTKVEPYVLIGGGVAKVKQNVTFAVNGADITGNVAQYGVVLGSDLSGSFTKPVVSVGAGVAWPAWERLVVDFQFRYGRIFAEGGGINVSRAGVGLGVRF